MQRENTTDQFGQKVVTFTLPSDHIVIGTVTNHFEGHEHPGGGEVEVRIHDGRLRILSFDHTYAEGAASELAIALQNAYGRGQQSPAEVTS